MSFRLRNGQRPLERADANQGRVMRDLRGIFRNARDSLR